MGVDLIVALFFHDWLMGYVTHAAYAIIYMLIYLGLTFLIMGFGIFATVIDPTDEQI